MKRISKYHVEEILKKNPEWNVIDIGCGKTGGWESADAFLDVYDWSENYPNKKFIAHDLNSQEKLPFKDKEYDFVIASHILEHVDKPVNFCKELQRIGKAGYIEVPTPLADNLCSGPNQDRFGHKWWIFFDDHKDEIIIRKKRDIVHRTVEIPELNMLYPFFRESIVIEIFWEDSINARLSDEKYFYNGTKYDLEIQNIQPWVLGSSVLSRVIK